MTLFPFRLRSAAGLLALTLLCTASRGLAGTKAGSSELSFSSATQSTITTVVGNGVPVGGTITPGLFGNVTDLNFKPTKSGATRAKATVALVNTSSTSLRNVTATVYLSDDNTLSSDDLQIAKLSLSDYVAKGKVAKYGSFQLPFNYKVPSVLDSYLNGKYLIIVLSADNLGTLETTPIVVGPITLP